jgi:hypothetical protein
VLLVVLVDDAVGFDVVADAALVVVSPPAIVVPDNPIDVDVATAMFVATVTVRIAVVVVWPIPAVVCVFNVVCVFVAFIGAVVGDPSVTLPVPGRAATTDETLVVGVARAGNVVVGLLVGCLRVVVVTRGDGGRLVVTFLVAFLVAVFEVFAVFDVFAFLGFAFCADAVRDRFQLLNVNATAQPTQNTLPKRRVVVISAFRGHDRLHDDPLRPF